MIIPARGIISLRYVFTTGRNDCWALFRDNNSLYFIRKYIRENPLNWSDDQENHVDREINEFQMDF